MKKRLLSIALGLLLLWKETAMIRGFVWSLQHRSGAEAFRQQSLRRTLLPHRNAGWEKMIVWNSHSMPESLPDRDAAEEHVPSAPVPPQSVSVVGGGLAGLAVVYHLLQKQKQSPPCRGLKQITVWDTASGPGLGGASAVAGGLVHPLSPRGKLVHLGLEGLDATNLLIDAALNASSCAREDGGSNNIVLQDELWRVASTPTQVQQLQQTARDLPHLATWRDVQTAESNNSTTLWTEWGLPPPSNNVKDEDAAATKPQQQILGALRLSNGCRVLHVPSYLQSLWKACQDCCGSLAGSGIQLEWRQLEQGGTRMPRNEDLQNYDTVVLAAGASIFQEYLTPNDIDENEDKKPLFPIQLVRGQSMELVETSKTNMSSENDKQQHPALLCGKYVSPLPPQTSIDGKRHRRRILVGATHEFSSIPLSSEQVRKELKERIAFLAPHLFLTDSTKQYETNGQPTPTEDDCWSFTLDRITSGYRVQSQRGKYGRLPLVGHLPSSLSAKLKHKNSWILTGLSSRGLLYHALFAQALAEAIWVQDETVLLQAYPELEWWKTRPVSKMAAVQSVAQQKRIRKR